MQSFQQQSDAIGWIPTLTSIGVGALGGTIIGGIPGGAIGLTAGIMDEALMSYGITNQHYLSTSAFWATMASKSANYVFPNHALSTSIASAGAGVLFSAVNSDFLNFKQSIQTPLEAFFTINRFFDKEEILSAKELGKIQAKLWEDPIAGFELIKNDIQEVYENNEFVTSFIFSNALSITQTVFNFQMLKWMGAYGSNLFIHNLLIEHPAASMRTLAWEGGKVMGLFFAKEGVSMGISTLQTHINQKQFAMVLDKSTEILLEAGNSRKLMASNKGDEINQNLTFDLYVLLTQGVSGLTGCLTSISEASLALRMIQQKTSEAVGLYAITPLLFTKPMEMIAEKALVIANKLPEVEAKLWQIKMEISNNIEAISLRDGQAYMKQKYSDVGKEFNALKNEYLFFSNLKTSANTLVGYTQQGIDIAYIGYKHIAKELSLAEIPQIKSSLTTLFSFLSNNVFASMNNKEVNLSKARLEQLFDIINAPSTSSVKRNINEEGQVIFDDYTLTLDGKEIVHIDHLELEPGKHYAFTGTKGCGKTSTLIDMKEGIFPPLSSSGTISIPTVGGHPAKMMFIDQKLYLPAKATLIESIYFPGVFTLLTTEEQSEVKAQIVYLLKELETDKFINDPSKDAGLLTRLDSSEFKLSGGQSKEVAIIQAILNAPNVLILDESFVGLDKKSLIKVESIIQMHLPNTTIIAVDHHAADNNYAIRGTGGGFYDQEVHFGDGRVTLKALPVKPVDMMEWEIPPVSHEANWLIEEGNVCAVPSVLDWMDVCGV